MIPALLRAVQAAGHEVFAGGDFDLNLVVERAPERRAGREDDLLSVLYLDRGRWRGLSVPCSADPGTTFLAHPENPAGTAIVLPGQYRRSHRRGLHRGRAALVQVGSLDVGRDADLDSMLEPSGRYSGLFGINIHDDAGVGAQASAGCIVLATTYLAEVLDLVDQQEARGLGPFVSLTVLQV